MATVLRRVLNERNVGEFPVSAGGGSSETGSNAGSISMQGGVKSDVIPPPGQLPGPEPAAPPRPFSVPPGCPAPLEWQDVIREFYGSAEAWYLDRPGYRLSGRMWGQGKPLYFLNGIGGSLDLFALTVYLLRDEFRCVLYDYPGTVKGSFFRGNSFAHVTLDTLADDLLAIADQCGDETVSLFATSFGSLVALRALALAPERFGPSIIQGGFASRCLSRTERLLVQVLRCHPGRLRHLPFRKLLQGLNHRAWFPAVDATRWSFFVDNSGRVPVSTLAHRSAIVRDVDLRESLPAVRQRILLIRSEGDGAVPAEHQERLEQSLPSAATAWMHNTGHLPYLTHPHRLAKVIREFLQSPIPDPEGQ